MARRGITIEPIVKYEMEEQDDIDAQLLTPQVTIDVAQRRKPYIQQREYDDNGVTYDEDQDSSSTGYDMDYVYMSDNSQEGTPHEEGLMKLEHISRSRQGRKRPSSLNNSRKPPKMYELDVRVHPEAAAARASYENRIRKKAEKEEMINRLNFLTERNKVLEEENAVLKEKLLEYEMNVTTQDWVLFFRCAGIRNGHDRKYASIFDENRIKPNMLMDLNEQWLRDMEIVAVGDILAILKHAKLVHAKTNGRKLHFSSPSLLQPRPPIKKSLDKAQGSNNLIITNVCSLTKKE